MDYLWQQRHRSSDLMGTIINVHSGDWIRRGQCWLLVMGKLLLSSLVMMAFDVFIFGCLLFCVLFFHFICWGGLLAYH